MTKGLHAVSWPTLAQNLLLSPAYRAGYDRLMAYGITILIAAVLGWITLDNIWRPMRSFFELRRQVKLQMSRYQNLKWHVTSIFDDIPAGKADQVVFGEAYTVLGNLADDLVTFAKADRLAAFLLQLMGIDPARAGRSLANLADELGSHNEDRDRNYREVARLLKF